MDQILVVGEDQYFHTRELHLNHEITHVASIADAVSLLETMDFGAIIARDGADLLSHVRVQGKHTPFLNLSHVASAVDCCGGHLSPEASLSEKTEVLGELLKRNHNTDC